MTRRLRHRQASVLIVAILGAVACEGSNGREIDSASGTIPPARTIEVPTDVPTSIDPASSGSSDASTPPTAVAPTHTLPAPAPSLPQPEPPPPDDGTTEPVVALGSITIPAIGIDRPLYEGIRLPTFNLGPGHWPGTAMPGEVGNMVIGGHRTSGHADFRDLDRLHLGAEVIVTDVAGTAHVYLVDRVEITDPFAARVVHQTPERTATLFACHPPGSIAQRIVVHLTLAD